MKILNAYCGIGGNRKLWKGHQITAIENNPEIAKIYQDFFPKDKIIVTDAHQYLLDHFKEFDFIWSSPPCPSHSRLVFSNESRMYNINHMKYPDMALYQEIIFLQTFFKGIYVVENVKPYYEPLVPAQCSGRHLFWCNFRITDLGKKKEISITNCNGARRRIWKEHIQSLQEYHGFDLSKYKQIGKHAHYKLLANCVNPKLGLHIFNCAFKEKQHTLAQMNPKVIINDE